MCVFGSLLLTMQCCCGGCVVVLMRALSTPVCYVVVSMWDAAAAWHRIILMFYPCNKLYINMN